MLIQKKPFSLLKGDTIDLVAPGSAVSKAQIKQASLMVKNLGYIPKTRGNFIAQGSLLITKAKAFSRALSRPISKAIWCLRGGYGCQKLLSHLLLNKTLSTTRTPKLLIGYSDISILQMYMYDRCSWPSLHFPVLAHLYRVSKSNLNQFQSLVAGQAKTIDFKKLGLLNPLNFKSIRPSILLGGNMTLIQTSIGTPWLGPSFFKDKFLFLEDIGEAPYRIDRALWQMKNAGVFRGLRALILGDFICSPFPCLTKTKNSLFKDPNSKTQKMKKTLVDDLTQKKSLEKVFKNFAREVKFPVFKGLPLGHGFQNSPLPLGVKARIECLSLKTAHLKVNSPFI